MDLKSFDWRSLKRFASPQAAGDLNVFLESLPQNAGQTALAAAGIAWACGAAIGLFATVQSQKMTEMREQLRDVSALRPAVPKIQDVPVDQASLKNFSDTLSATYPGLTIRQQGAAIFITSSNTANFGQFREAIGHVQNGGQGWRVNVEKLCVGRECSQSDKLAALLRINKVTVEKP